MSSLTKNRLANLAGRPVLGIGTITINPGLTAKEITEGISSMIHIGEIVGSEEAVCALFSVCDRRLGTYRVQVPETAYSAAS